jgi:hypothetical protein
MKTQIYNNSLNEDFEKMLLNLEKIEEESLADLKKLASLDEIISVESSGYGTIGNTPYLHKCSDGHYVDIKGISTIYPKIDNDHLLNLIQYMVKYGNTNSKLKILKDEAAKRKLKGYEL